jgi:hypothetical protein
VRRSLRHHALFIRVSVQIAKTFNSSLVGAVMLLKVSSESAQWRDPIQTVCNDDIPAAAKRCPSCRC